MNRKIRILFIGPRISSFVEQDLDILKKHFTVRVLNSSGRKIGMASMDIIKSVIWADITFSWFALNSSALAVLSSKIFRKRAIVVTGGYDVANEPSINYGIMRFPKSRAARIAKFVLNHADLILPFSKFSMMEVLKYSKPKRLEVVYCCVDTEKFKPGSEKLDDLVVTIGYVTNNNLQRKGLETFVKSATFLPKIKFVLIGDHVDDSVNYLRSIASPNVTFTGFVHFENLLEYLQKAKVYVQVSAQEGFGVAIAEAMLCECVPVVTDRGAIPEVVGEAGYYVPYGDAKATAEAIKHALAADGKRARERITRNFPLQRREVELVEMVEKFG